MRSGRRRANAWMEWLAHGYRVTFMIVDCHTHIWQSPDQLGQLDLGNSPRWSRKRPSRISAARGTGRNKDPAAGANHKWVKSGTDEKSFVLGFKSRYLLAGCHNGFVSEYVRR